MVKGLLRVEQLPDLFTAIPTALSSWLPSALVRLYLLDGSHQSLYSFRIVGTHHETMTVPLAKGTYYYHYLGW